MLDQVLCSNDVLFVDKPRYMSSRGVVIRLMKDFGMSKRLKWGFVGTLDPMASGLLPVCVGWKTKLISVLEHVFWDKTYVACVGFGCEREGGDRSGVVKMFEQGRRPSLRRLQGATHWVGKLQKAVEEISYHVPPTLSAKHVGGKRAYALVRQGKDVFLPSVPIQVAEATCLATRRVDSKRLGFWGWWRFRVSKGAYIRSLVRDLGVDLGIGAHLGVLKRVALGPIQYSDLGFGVSKSGVRFALKAFDDMVRRVSFDGMGIDAGAIVSGRQSVIVLKRPEMGIGAKSVNWRDSGDLGLPFCFGNLTWRGRLYGLLLEAQEQRQTVHRVCKYKVLKRIEVPNNIEAPY